MKWLWFCTLLLSSAVLADAADDAKARNIQAELQHIQTEQQSLYQQFQMLQGLRRTELQSEYPTVIENSPVYGTDNAPPDYDALVRQKQERQQRIKQYGDELNTLYGRYQELENQKKPLVDVLNQMNQPR
jgi:predicted  nucleic acid-binding Zn-ribbon protein